MITYLTAAIKEDSTFWGLDKPFELSETIRKTLELKLIDQVNELNYDNQTKRQLQSIVKSKEAKVMLEVMKGVEEDDISSETIQKAQEMVSAFYEKDLGKFFDSDATPDDKVRALLEPLGFSDIPLVEYAGILKKASTLKDKMSPYYHLLFELHGAKLLYLKKDPACIQEFDRHLPQLIHFNKHISLLQQGYWYLSLIHI